MVDQHLAGNSIEMNAPHTGGETTPASDLRARFVPKRENMLQSRIGINLSGKDKYVDLGGSRPLGEKLKKEENVDWDKELYGIVRQVLSPYLQAKKSAHAKGLESSDADQLSPLAQIVLERLETWENTANAIEELKDKTLRKDARIFQNGLDVELALAFTEQTEIIASHALGANMTNGGKRSFDITLNTAQLNVLDTAAIPPRYRQAAGAIISAIKSKNVQAFTDAAKKWGPVIGSAGIGAITGVIFHDPALGIGVALGGSALYGITRWSFGGAVSGDGFKIELKYDTSGVAKVADNSLAKRNFLDPVKTETFLKRSESVRYGVYNRLGLDVGKHKDVNWTKLTKDQTRIVKSIGYDPTVITPAQKIIAEKYLTGDLGLLDLNLTNMAVPGYSSSDLHYRVHERIQKILETRTRGVSANAITADVSYRDFSGVTAEQSEEIQLEAYNQVAADICDHTGFVIVKRLSERGKVEVIAKGSILTKKAEAIAQGKEIHHKNVVTEQDISEANKKLAEARSNLKLVETHGASLTDIAAQLVTKRNELATLDQTAINTELTQGHRSSAGPPIVVATGEIAKFEAKIATIQAEIDKLDDELGRPDPTTKKYPPTSKLGELEESKARKTNLTLEIQSQNTKLSAATHSKNNAELTAAEARLTTLRGDYATAEGDVDRIQREVNSLEEQKRNKKTQRDSEEGHITSAETLVNDAKKRKQEKEDEIKIQEGKQKGLVTEVQRLTGEDKKTNPADVSKIEVYSIVYARMKTEFEETEKQMIENGLVREKAADWTEQNPTYKPIVSKEDKEIEDGLTLLAAAVGTEANYNGIVSKIILNQVDISKLTYDEMMALIWGADVVGNAEKFNLAKRIITRETITEAVFDYIKLDSSRAALFFGNIPAITAEFNQTRAAKTRLETIYKDIDNIKAKNPADAANRLSILSQEAIQLQTESARVLSGIYDEFILPVISEHRTVASEIVRLTIDRAIDNGIHDRIFADSAEMMEAVPEHRDSDGVVTIKTESIDPESGDWIRGNVVDFTRADGKMKAKLTVNTSQELDVEMTLRVDSLADLIATLPDIKANIVTQNLVVEELKRRGIYDDLYETGGGRRVEADVIANRMATDSLPPTLPPDMTNLADPNVVLVNNFLKKYGLSSLEMDTIYPPGGGTPPPIEATIEENIIKKHFEAQAREIALELQIDGLSNMTDALLWINGTSRFKGQHPEFLVRSLARSMAENPVSINNTLLGDRMSRISHAAGGITYEVYSENGQIVMLFKDSAGNIHTKSLHDVLIYTNETERQKVIPGLTDIALSDILVKTGNASLEAVRKRNP